MEKKQLAEARKDYEDFGGWQAFKSGEWLLLLIQKSFKNYWEQANVDDLHQAHGTRDNRKIATALVSLTARNSALLGAATGAAISTDQILAIVSGTAGGIGLPANIAVALAAIGSESILTVRLQLQLVANLGKLYGVQLDPDDPENVLSILAFALGGTVADAAATLFGVKVGSGISGHVVKTIFGKELLKQMKGLGSKVGLKILQRSIVKYTVPLFSVGIGGTWNYYSTVTVAKIAEKHFTQRGGRL